MSFDMLIKSLAASAVVHLGDATNPAAGVKTPPNLEAASQMIDLLTLVEEKTQGNLSDTEAAFLAETLRAVRARFLEVRRRARADAATTGRP